MSTASLVRMANQIAANFSIHPAEQAAGEVATHIGSFWAPSMRRDLLAYIDAGGDGLDPVVLDAMARVRLGKG